MNTDTDMAVSASDAGVWIDGYAGVYARAAMVSVAGEYGYRIPTEWAEAIRAEAAWLWPDMGQDELERYWDALPWIVDAAEAHLQSLAPAGFMFGWLDGDFILAPMCEDEDEACTDESCWHWLEV